MTSFPDIEPQIEAFKTTLEERGYLTNPSADVRAHLEQAAQLDPINPCGDDEDEEDTSLIAATIGVDVLEALVKMAKPSNHGEQVYFNIARNALHEATKDIPKPDRYADQRPWDGPFVIDGKDGDPSELDYECKDHCDGCDDLNHTNLKTKVLGTMFHARGATGRVCPVLFLCKSCLEKRS